MHSTFLFKFNEIFNENWKCSGLELLMQITHKTDSMDSHWSENAKCYIFEIPPQNQVYFSIISKHPIEEYIVNLSKFAWTPFETDIQ